MAVAAGATFCSASEVDFERYWKLFKKKVLYNRCYEKFQEFKKARVRFFRQSRRYLKALLIARR